MRFGSAAAMPMLWSCTASSAQSPARATQMVVSLPDGLYLAALTTRFATTRSRRNPSHVPTTSIAAGSIRTRAAPRRQDPPHLGPAPKQVLDGPQVVRVLVGQGRPGVAQGVVGE